VECGDILSGKIQDIPKNRDYDAIIRLLDRHSNLDNIYTEVKEDDNVAVSAYPAPVTEEQKENVIESNIQSNIQSNIPSANTGNALNKDVALNGGSDDDMDLVEEGDENVTDEGVKDNENQPQ